MKIGPDQTEEKWGKRERWGCQKHLSWEILGTYSYEQVNVALNRLNFHRIHCLPLPTLIWADGCTSM